MKPSEIKAGKVYCNRGKGLTMRRVVDIHTCWVLGKKYSSVKFLVMDATGNQLTTYSDSCPLSTFAKWAGKEVEI